MKEGNWHKKTLLVGFSIIFFFITPIKGKTYLWKGNLDQNGTVEISFSLPKEKAFFLEGYIYYKKNWRKIPIFWEEKKIWIDLGPPFKEIPYRIHLWIPNEE